MWNPGHGQFKQRYKSFDALKQQCWCYFSSSRDCGLLVCEARQYFQVWRDIASLNSQGIFQSNTVCNTWSMWWAWADTKFIFWRQFYFGAKGSKPRDMYHWERSFVLDTKDKSVISSNSSSNSENWSTVKKWWQHCHSWWKSNSSAWQTELSNLERNRKIYL
jgi:hypothetical protein